MNEDRYTRLDAIDWWAGDRIRSATAVVAGAGALGNEVVKNLVLLGWGTVVVVDHDVIEISNLSRSVFFRGEDVGRPKALVLGERAGAVNPDTRIVGLDGDLRVTLSAGLVRRAAVVLGCVDNLAARVALSQLTRRAGRVLIDGGLTTWEGAVQVFAPGSEGPCLACGLTEDDLRDLTLRHSCLAYQRRSEEAGGMPTTPTVASVTAGLMVQEAVKWLHRDRHGQSDAVGRELRVDLAHNRFWSSRLFRNDDCVLHDEPGDPVTDGDLDRSDSWHTIVERCRAIASMPDGVLRLPFRLLVRWDCLACGAEDDTVRAYSSDGPLPCPNCGSDVVPRFVTNVDGTERWADRSLSDTDVAPWTWLELRQGDAMTAFELMETSPSGDRQGVAG